MDISVSFGHARDPRQLTECARRYEALGVRALWLSETYGFDSATALGFLASVTSHVGLGSSILNTYSRSPALIAQTAAGLDVLSGGRALLGLGSSGPQVIEGWHGVPFGKPLARTRDVIAICRQVWARDPLRHEGSITVPLVGDGTSGSGKSLKLSDRPVRDRIPVYLAAIGVRNVELAAEVADGWLPFFFMPERASEVWGPALRRGSERRGGDLAPLTVVADAAVAIGDDLNALRDQCRAKAALYIGGMGASDRNFYNTLAGELGYESEAALIQEHFLSGRRDDAAAAVPDEFIDRTNLLGSISAIRDRLAAYRDAGVGLLNVTPLGPDPVGTVAAVMSVAS